MEGYSPEKFRAAQKAGQKELPPGELAKYDRLKDVELDLGKDVLANVPMGSPIAGIPFLLTQLLDKDRRAVMTGALRRLEKKRTETTEEGQLKAAQEEAEKVNKEFDAHARYVQAAAEELKMRVEEFDEWKKELATSDLENGEVN